MLQSKQFGASVSNLVLLDVRINTVNQTRWKVPQEHFPGHNPWPKVHGSAERLIRSWFWEHIW